MYDKDGIDFDSAYITLKKAVPDKHPMWYSLHIVGIWCRGKKGKCYAGNTDSCYKCPFYNGRGCN